MSTAKFYTFRQNNSGGSFDEDDNVSLYVIVEAMNADQASARAKDAGVYFNGCNDGMDCHCCGDRWYRGYSEGTASPEVYGKVVQPNDKFVEEGYFIKWIEGPEGFGLGRAHGWYEIGGIPLKEEEPE